MNLLHSYKMQPKNFLRIAIFLFICLWGTIHSAVAQPLSPSACSNWMKNPVEIWKAAQALQANTGRYISPNEYANSYYYSRINRWVSFSDEEGSVFIYDLKKYLNRNGTPKRDFRNIAEKEEKPILWRDSVGHQCDRRTNTYIAPVTFLGETREYRLFTNSDICGANPTIDIYFDYRNENRYTPAKQRSLKNEFLENFYVRWDYNARYLRRPPIRHTHSQELGHHIKLLMINQCGALPSKVRIRALHAAYNEIGDTVFKGGNKNRKPSETVSERIMRAQKKQYEFYIPKFEIIYGGALSLIDIRQDLNKEINAYTDLIYIITDDDPDIRENFVANFKYEVRVAQREQARRNAIAERRRSNYVNRHKINAAFMEGIVQGLTLNLADEILCGVGSAEDAATNSCYKEYDDNLNRMKNQYGDAYAIGNILGMIITPTSVLYPEEIRNSKSGVAFMEGLEGVVSAYGEAGFYRSVSQEEVAVNVITGGVVGLALGGKK